jgi:hypothetical protein
MKVFRWNTKKPLLVVLETPAQKLLLDYHDPTRSSLEVVKVRSTLNRNPDPLKSSTTSLRISSGLVIERDSWTARM